MKARLLLAALAALLLSAIPARAEVDLSIKPGDQVVAVDVSGPDRLKLLLDMDLDVWTHDPGEGAVDVHVSIKERERLTAAGFAYKVKIEDLFADRQREIAETQVRSPGDFLAYKNLADITAFINNLATTRPDLCQVSQFGTSVENRPMYVLKITGPTPGPKNGVFYHGLIHAREWITAPIVMYLADYLVANYDTDPCVRALVDRTEFYLVPCVNPDGYSYTWTNTRLWRKNRRNNGTSYGVDLNRNYGYQWGYDNSGSSGTPSSDLYRGPSAFSEPETQAIRDFILARPNIKAYMDYHSYSQLLMWAWGYTPTLTPDNARFALIGNYMRDLIIGVHGMTYVAGPINTTIYPANGTSVDWAYGGAGRFAYTIELRDTGSFGFQLPADQIVPTCQENLPGILYLSRWASSGVLLDAPNGVPTELPANFPTNVTVNIADAQETYVAGSAQLYYRFNPSDPFTAVPFTLVTGSTYSATLPAAPCGVTAEYYMTAAGNGGFVAALPCNAPTATYSAPVLNFVPAQTIYSFPMDSNPGWTTMGQWAFGVPTGTCGDPTSGYTGTNVFGYNLAGCYPNNLTPIQYLTTTALNCTNVSNAQLRFRRRLGIESSQYDHANIQVSNDGSNWTTVWNFSGGTLQEATWSLQTYDISATADGQATVYIRWGMGTTDGSVTYAGWNIDDVEILGVPIANCTGVPVGDVNHDLAVNGADVNDFVRVFLNPGVASSPDLCAADIDGVCGVTQEDLDLFVNLLLGL